jgi:hypothetical protein
MSSARLGSLLILTEDSASTGHATIVALGDPTRRTMQRRLRAAGGER